MKTKTRKRFEHIDEIPEFAETQTQLAELVATKKRVVKTLRARFVIGLRATPGRKATLIVVVADRRR